MTRPLHAFHEPTPDYMKRLLMLGARFVEGNTGEGTEPETPATEEEAPEAPAADTGEGDKDEPLGEGGKKALERERQARKDAEQRAKDAEAALRQYQDAEKNSADQQQEPATDTATGPDDTQRDLWLYKALVDHPVPEEYRHLVKGDTEEEVVAAAESVSQLASRPGVVKKSGTTGDSSPTGTSTATGRDLYRSRHNRNRKD